MPSDSSTPPQEVFPIKISQIASSHGLDQRLRSVRLAAHQLLGLRDVSRTDAVVDADGRVQILEVNVSPGLTETSLLPTAVRAAGMKLGDLYGALVERGCPRLSCFT